MPTGTYQKYCGARTQKKGCSYRNYVHFPKVLGKNKNHLSIGRDSLRNRLLNKHGNKCQKCGIENKYSSFFDMDHRDGNRKNNKMSNLWILCPNCHRIKTIKNGENKKRN